MVIIESKANYIILENGCKWHIVKTINDGNFEIGLTPDGLIKDCFKIYADYKEQIKASELPREYHLKYSSYYN